MHTFPEHPNRAEMRRNAEAYRAMHETLVDNYLGQFVASATANLSITIPTPSRFCSAFGQIPPTK